MININCISTHFYKKLSLILLIMVLLAGISAVLVKMNGTEKMGEFEEKFTIVTSFYPVYIATLNLTQGIDDIQVINLTENHSGCIHDYQLTTRDMRVISNADVFVMNGGGMEEFVHSALENYSNIIVIDSTEGMTFLEGSGHEHSHSDVNMEEEYVHEEAEHTEEHVHEEAEHTEEHVHEEEEHVHEEAEHVHEEAEHTEEHVHEEAEHTEEHVHEEAEHTEEHVHGAYNAHVWMSLTDYQVQIEKIANGLAAADIEHADIYMSNYVEYINRLDEVKVLLDELRTYLKGEHVITFNDSFVYLAKELEMEVVYSVNLDEDSSLSAGEIAEVIDEINLHNIFFLWVDEGAAASISSAISTETGAEVLVLNPLTSGTADIDSYIEEMKRNIEIISQYVK